MIDGKAWAVAGAMLAAATMVGCGDSRACAVDADCFSGEFCSADDECVSGQRVSNNTPANNGETSGGTTGNNGGDSNTNSGTTSSPAACIVDRFGNTCDDDPYEENDLYTQTLPIPLAQDSWCLDGELVAPVQSFEGTLCAGDTADLYRFFIDNRIPHECLVGTFTMRITVELDEPCDPENVVRIFPYPHFENPVLNSPCGQDEDLRCTVSEDKKTHTFDVLWRSEQMPDQRLNIEARRDDVQVDYTVTVEILQ